MKKNFEITEFCLGDGFGENYQREENETGCLGDGVGENCQRDNPEIAIDFGIIAGDWYAEKMLSGENTNVLQKAYLKAIREENWNQLFLNLMADANIIGEIDEDIKEEFIDILEFFLKKEKRIHNKTISNETKIVEAWSRSGS